MANRTLVALWLLIPASILAQRGTPSPAKASAPIDLTGYWVSVVHEDWHVRMLTAPKGDFGTGQPGTFPHAAGFVPPPEGVNPAMGGNIPYNLKGAKLAMAWDPAKDEADGNQCKAFGAMGIMRLPERLHVSWQDDNTLKLEFDFGKQTRLFHFVPEPPQAQPGGRFVSDKLMPQAPSGPPSLQGFSVAAWHAMGGTRPD